MSEPPIKNARLFSNAIIIVIFALLIQGTVLIRFSHTDDLVPEGGDMQFYSDWGRRIANGQWTDGKAFYGLPGYAYLLAGKKDQAEKTFASVQGTDGAKNLARLWTLQSRSASAKK
ncbi:MAG: hypothetical protein V4710_02260 [Verrucomicrobiota bacterium]